MEELDGDLDTQQDSGFKSVDLKGSIKATGAEPEAEDAAGDKSEPEAEAEDVADAQEGKKGEVEALEAKAGAAGEQEGEAAEEAAEKADFSLLD